MTTETVVAPADETAEVAPLPTAGEDQAEQQEEIKEKTFSQAEVDAMIQRRLLKEERRIARRLEQQLREQQQTHEAAKPREAYQDDESYIQAQIEKLAEQRAAEKLAERQRQQEVERRSESFIEKAEKAQERYPDFQLVVGNPNLTINEEMAEFIADSDVGADVAYFLGKNPTKAAEIARMSPVKAARELNRIETDLASRPQARVSKAPEPITPVGNRGRASTSSTPSDEDDIETWMRKERARMTRR